MHTGPERGIVITTAELASEGVDAVLDTVDATGANAITTTTQVVVEAAGGGLREPPADASDEVRVLDRPLWGKHAVRVQRYAAHPHDPTLWRDLPWDPPPVAPEPARVDHARHAIDAARARGLRAHVQVVPYVLPGGSGGQESASVDPVLRDPFRPKRFIGGAHPDGIAFTGCLNHPDVRALGRARLCEALRHYGDVDGIVLDWVEYPVYFFEKLFTCFCEHCQRQAAAIGFDWGLITASVRILWDSLHTLTPEQVRAHVASGGDWGDLVSDPERMLAGFDAWLDFKAASVALAIEDLRGAMTGDGAGHLELATAEFALPWGRMTGAAFAPPGDGIAAQRIKLYSFHWLMMANWWTATLLSWNRGSAITPAEMTRGVMALFGLDLHHEPAPLEPGAFGMPGPGKDHGLTMESYTVRLANALELAERQAPMMPLLHAYRPAAELAAILEALRPYSGAGIWIHRYGYLGDDKLAILRQEWSRS